jgi:hypothetical protein
MQKKLTLGLFLVTALACSEGNKEPGQHGFQVVVDSAHVQSCENDLGWQVEPNEFKLAMRDLEFTIEGEAHVDAHGVLQRIADFLVPVAMAHPGHLAGGDVTGELRGNLLVDALHKDGENLGQAELLEGDYNGFNLTFRTAGEADGIAPEDPLYSHTAYISGTATKGAESVQFSATLDIEEGTQMIGGVFDLDVGEETEAVLGLGVLTIDPFENDTLFDGIDFGILNTDSNGVALIEPGSAAHNILSKTLVRHDHYQVAMQTNGGQTNE